MASAEDAFGARGLASPCPLLDAFSCTFCGLPVVSVWFLVPVVYVEIQAHSGCLRGVPFVMPAMLVAFQAVGLCTLPDVLRAFFGVSRPSSIPLAHGISLNSKATEST